MTMQIYAVATLLGLAQVCEGGLLRVPRVYNALVTSDERLLPSQAYPAVSPVISPAQLYLEPYPHPEDRQHHTIHHHQPHQEHHQPLVQPHDVQTEEQLPLYKRLPDELPDMDRVKNNRPSDPRIPDVPPPPLPVGRSNNKRDNSSPPPFPII